MRYNKSKCKFLHLSRGSLCYQYKWGDERIDSSSAENKTGGTGEWQAGPEPAMCPHNPENQLYFGLHKKKCGQQVKGGDPAPLLCANETLSGALRPDANSSVQERHGYAEMCPEEGHNNDASDGTPSPLGG